MKLTNSVRILATLVIFSTLASCGSCNQGKIVATPPPPTPAVPEVLLIQGKTFEGFNHNDLPFKVYQFLSGSPENVNYSPLSTEMAFSMAHLGANGKTKESLEKLFGFKSDTPYAFSGELAMAKELQTRKSENGPRLLISNSVWAKNQKAVLKSYKEELEKKLDGAINPIDLSKLNQWAAEHTENKIQNLLSKIDPNTTTILLNTLYFKAKWAHEFDHQHTHTAVFQASPYLSTKVQMMSQTTALKYYENAFSQWVELPYQESSLSMILALPTKRLELRSLEDKLNDTLIKEVSQKLVEKTVELQVPKFKFFKTTDLTQTFTNAGYSDLFKGSDYTRYQPRSDSDKLKVDRILQATAIEVDEKGTEAAAATAVMMMASARPDWSERKKFKADEPFLFMIRNMKSGEIYFLGRVFNPNQK